MGIRERILAACRDLARSRGFKSLTVDELAEQAGISKRTLYRYFRSKEEIIEAAFDEFMQEMLADMDKVIYSGDDPSDIIANAINLLLTKGQVILHPQGLNDLQRYYPHLWAKVDTLRTGRIMALFGTLNQNGWLNLEEGIDSRIAAAVVIASIHSIINPEFILNNQLTVEQTIRQLSTLLKRMFILK